MTEDGIILKLDNIKKSFGDREILRGVSLDAREGEFITLLGSSGCGKTTTIRIIAGLTEPDSGNVYLDGTDITRMPPEKRNVNTIFQNYALFPNMNVIDNIAYGLKIRGVPKKERTDKAMEMLSTVKLDGYEKRRVDELSGGEKQRVAIARAVINEPKVLLLDEPLGALDLKLRRQMQIELKRFQKALGITFIYITHDQEEAINMSDRIAVMHNGLFEQTGTPNEIYYGPKTSYVANFVGNSNIIRDGDRYIALRSENVIIDDEAGNVSARVLEKSFAGGQLRIEFELADGQLVTASRTGIDSALREGDITHIGWKDADAVEVEYDGV